jgi:hypothetical protein
MDFNINKAQGAIEYLLLIGAAILVVGIVVTAMIQTIAPAKETGNIETYRYLCETLDSNTLDCGCYLHDETIGGATAELCCAKDIELLREKWKNPATGACP